jgi:hypothetical protein
VLVGDAISLAVRGGHFWPSHHAGTFQHEGTGLTHTLLSAPLTHALLRQQWCPLAAYSSLARPPPSSASLLARSLMPPLSAHSSPQAPAPAPSLAVGAPPHSSHSQHGEYEQAYPHVARAASGHAASQAVKRTPALLLSRLHTPLAVAVAAAVVQKPKPRPRSRASGLSWKHLDLEHSR